MNQTDRYVLLVHAVENLIKCKGRYHTEQAMKNLVEVFNKVTE